MTLDVPRQARSRPDVLQYAPMPVRYVCISDLHLGAENSLLSNVAPGETTVDLGAPSEVLVQLVDALAALLGRLSAGTEAPKPTLVLNGDILELALARDEVALGVFTQLLELVFERHDLFDPVVVYLPGNHDHPLWGSDFDSAHANTNGNGNGNGESAWTTHLFDTGGAPNSSRTGGAHRCRAPPSRAASRAVRAALPHLRGRVGRPPSGRVPPRPLHGSVVGIDQRAAARRVPSGAVVAHLVGS